MPVATGDKQERGKQGHGTAEKHGDSFPGHRDPHKGPG